MKKITFFVIILLPALAFGQGKPMLGEQIDWSHQLGDPVGAWFFNEGSGNKVYDLSGNGNTGTLVADTHFVPGKFGSVLDFDGTGDLVDFGDVTILDGLSSLTISVWVKNNLSVAAFHTVLSKGDVFGVDLYWDDTERFIWLVNTEEGQRHCHSTLSYTDNNWHHIVGVYDGTNLYQYIDGVLGSDVVGQTGVTVDVAFPLQIGASGGLSRWNGQIDLPMVWNQAKSASEIAELYREPFCMFQKDDIELMAVEAPSPPTGVPTLYYYSFAPFVLIGYCFMIGRKNGA